MATETLTVLPKRYKVKGETGIFFKEIQRTRPDGQGNSKTKIVDKLYLVRYQDEHKKERLITIGKESEGYTVKYCRTKRVKFIDDAEQGELPPLKKRRDKKEIVTLDSLADVYFDNKKVAVQRDGQIVKDAEGKTVLELQGTDKRQKGKYDLHLKERFGSLDLRRLVKADFTSFKKELEREGKAKRTINGILSLASAIINHSIKDHDLKINNPLVGIKAYKVNTIRRERYLSLDEARTLVNTVRNSEDDELYHFVQLALNTGGRANTILAITKKDINFTDNHITLNDLKSDSTYTGFIGNSTYLLELKKKVKGLDKNDTVITMPMRTLQRKLKKILDDLFNEGLKARDFKNRVVIHTLRHTFASQLVISGVSLYQVKELMNHASLDMTERYAKLNRKSGANAVEGLFND